MKIFTSDLKKYTIIFRHIPRYCTSFAFRFWTGNKLLMSATTANKSQNVSWRVIVSGYIA